MLSPSMRAAGVIAIVLGAVGCDSEGPNLDATRARFENPTATLDRDLAERAADFLESRSGAARGLVCTGYLFGLIQKFVDAVAPGGGSDGGTDSDGGTSEGFEVNGLVLNFSGDVAINAPCPGEDGVLGTADDGSLHADGTVRHAVLDPLWRAEFRQCYFPTECAAVAADGSFLLDLGQSVKPGETITFDDLVARYEGRLVVAQGTIAEATLEIRKRADGLDVILENALGKTAVLSLNEGGTVQLTTADGTYTCDFPARQCTNDDDSRVFSF